MGAKHEHHFWATICRTEIDRNETLTRRVLQLGEHLVQFRLFINFYCGIKLAAGRGARERLFSIRHVVACALYAFVLLLPCSLCVIKAEF